MDDRRQDERYPHVEGVCPSCGNADLLFLGSGGYVTCSWIHCPKPDAASAVLAGETAGEPPVGQHTGREWGQHLGSSLPAVSSPGRSER